MIALPFDLTLAVAYLGLFLVAIWLWARGRFQKKKRAAHQHEERGFLFYSELVLEVFMLAAACAAVIAGFRFFMR